MTPTFIIHKYEPLPIDWSAKPVVIRWHHAEEWLLWTDVAEAEDYLLRRCQLGGKQNTIVVLRDFKTGRSIQIRQRNSCDMTSWVPPWDEVSAEAAKILYDMPDWTPNPAKMAGKMAGKPKTPGKVTPLQLILPFPTPPNDFLSMFA